MAMAPVDEQQPWLQRARESAVLHLAANREPLPGGYVRVTPGMLIQQGDELLLAPGRYVPWPLEQVGKAVPPGVLSRRRMPRARS